MPPWHEPWHKDVLGQRHRGLPHLSHGSHGWLRAHPCPAWHHCSSAVPALHPSCVWGPLQCRGGWEGPRQQRGDAQDRPRPATTRARSCISAGPPWADTPHPSTCGTPNPPAAHQQLLTLLPNTPRASEHGCLGTQCHGATGVLGVGAWEGARGAEARAPRGAVFQPEPVRTLSGDEAVMGARVTEMPVPLPSPHS